jgi:amino-acid N-acetyltransferase
MGVPKVFGLTLKPQFFEKLGFKVVDKDELPMKVWSDCARCTKQQNCDETAVIRQIGNTP